MKGEVNVRSLLVKRRVLSFEECSVGNGHGKSDRITAKFVNKGGEAMLEWIRRNLCMYKCWDSAKEATGKGKTTKCAKSGW